MTDRTQFEAMLEALINEDQETAKEIFHNIVVAKSREIYEELLESDFDLNEGENPFASSEEEEGSEEEPADDDTGAEDDSAEGDDEEGAEGEEDPFGAEGDEESEGDAEGEEGEGDVEDRVQDLEDALEDLKAEFEQLMAGEENEPEHADMFGGDAAGGDMGGDMGAELGGDIEDESLGMHGAAMYEYVDKVALPKHGDNGVNTKSAVAGKNDMGGTTANIAKGTTSTTGGTQGGLLKPSTTLQDGGNVNVPGGNAGKTGFKKKEPGHGAEKKGSGDTAPDKKSLIGSRK
jgi:hypothetical protein